MCNLRLVNHIFNTENIDVIFHLAAKTHVGELFHFCFHSSNRLGLTQSACLETDLDKTHFCPPALLRVVVRIAVRLPAREHRRHQSPAASRPQGPAPAAVLCLRQHRRGVRSQRGTGEWSAGPRMECSLARLLNNRVVWCSAGV